MSHRFFGNVSVSCDIVTVVKDNISILNLALGRNLRHSSRRCLTVPVGGTIYSDNYSHNGENGTMTRNSSSWRSRSLQGVAGFSMV